MKLDPELSINQITNAFPSTLAILGEMGFDTCCGGWESIGAAAARLEIPWEKVAEALEPAMAGR